MPTSREPSGRIPRPASPSAPPILPTPYATDEPGWHPEDRGGHLVGSLCWAFPPDTLRRIVATFNGTESRRHIDAQIGRWAHSQNLTPFYHTPSLVQHTGNANSALGDSLETDLRRAGDFAGEGEWVW